MTMRIKHLFYIIFAFLAPSLVSCADEAEVVTDDEATFTFAAHSVWKEGRGAGTRAIDASLTTATPSVTTPGWLYVTAEYAEGGEADPAAFLLKPDDTRPDPDVPAGYTDYHGFYLLESGTWIKQKKMSYARGDAKKIRFTAYSYTENGSAAADPATPEQISALMADPVAVSGRDQMMSDPSTYPASLGGTDYRDHILFDLKHRTAMLRLSFAVSSSYDKIRSIVLRSVKINDTPLTITVTDALPSGSSEQGMLLTTGSQIFAIAYLNPMSIKATDPISFHCTYDIYDKDDIAADHCTRKGVTATNRVTLSSLPEPRITELKAGYYYDLSITIDPDYLYVLSEHDNKQHLNIR